MQQWCDAERATVQTGEAWQSVEIPNKYWFNAFCERVELSFCVNCVCTWQWALNIHKLFKFKCNQFSCTHTHTQCTNKMCAVEISTWIFEIVLPGHGIELVLVDQNRLCCEIWSENRELVRHMNWVAACLNVELVLVQYTVFGKDVWIFHKFMWKCGQIWRWCCHCC